MRTVASPIRFLVDDQDGRRYVATTAGRALFSAITPRALGFQNKDMKKKALGESVFESYRKAGGKRSLSDHYTAAYDGIVFHKRLRDKVLFSDHSLATDAVFAEVHLITCRNVLIYFDRALQDRAVGLFQEALVRRGVLGLGSKESLQLSAHADRFVDLVGRERIYQRV